MKLFTIGHSTNDLEAFAGLLTAHDVHGVIDVRRYPASRRYPHFNREVFAAELAKRDIAYEWFPDLGGRRKARADSYNTRWDNASFRGYADYMETEAFISAVARVEALASQRSSAIMCAEALWWRCHRSLIADYLMSRGVTVMHIVDAQKAERHRYTGPAQIVDGRLSYAEARLI